MLRHDQPLWHRIYFEQPVTDVCRLIGYEGCPFGDLWRKLAVAVEKHGRPSIEHALSLLVDYDGQWDVTKAKEDSKVALMPHVRKACWGLLGPPPDHTWAARWRGEEPLVPTPRRPGEGAVEEVAEEKKPKPARKRKKLAS